MSANDPMWLESLRITARNPAMADQQCVPIVNEGTYRAVAEFIDRAIAERDAALALAKSECDSNDTLRAQLARVREDVARLDWLEARSSFLAHQWQGGGWTLTLPQPPVDGVRPPPFGFSGTTLRAAIDAARHPGGADAA